MSRHDDIREEISQRLLGWALSRPELPADLDGLQRKSILNLLSSLDEDFVRQGLHLIFSLSARQLANEWAWWLDAGLDLSSEVSNYAEKRSQEEAHASFKRTAMLHRSQLFTEDMRAALFMAGTTIPEDDK